MTGHVIGDARMAQAAPEPDTDRLAALLVAHQRIPMFDGTDGQRCTGCDDLAGEPDGPNSPRHAAHVAAVLTENGVGFVAEAERDLLDGTWRARANRAEATLERVRALASLGAQAGTVNGRPFVWQDDLHAALDAAGGES